ncbi:isochorismatase family protein [Sulfurospirillum oryzae]|uniref:isochorismatase family protein n=1 Tax=Sulfurospirillum oryzae TaxID=2976535 RepID=UPI0021E6EB1B|nr:isochorismatase family protein [Sulfurospirillum oryzae]
MRLNPEQTAMLLVDVQERLFPHIEGHASLEKHLVVLLKGLQTFNIPILCNQQYTQGLGETIPSLCALLDDKTVYEKRTFSCYQNEEVVNAVIQSGAKSIILAGIESHVCVLQSALDLLEAGFELIVCVDAMGSRKRHDHEIALRRMEQEGARLCTTESLLFELLQSALHPKFKEISSLVKAL